MKPHSIAPLLLLVVVVTLLSGCGLSRDHLDEVTPDNIVGSWSATVDGHVIDLEIDADGRLTFQNVPTQAIGAEGPLDWSGALESTGGRWEIVSDPTGEGEPWFWIHAELIPGDPSSAGGTQLFVYGVEPSVELWQYWGQVEVDRPIVYERVNATD